MGVAWTLMSTNVKRMATALWLPAVVVALLAGATTTLCHLFRIHLFLAADIDVACLVALCVVVAGLCVASIILDAKMYKLLNMQALSFCCRRTIVVYVVALLLTIVVVALLWGCATMNTLLAATGKLALPTALVLGSVEILLLVVALLVFLSPFVFLLMKYMIEPATTLATLWRGYRGGLRQAGTLVAFILLMVLLIAIAYTIIALPEVIVSIAAWLSLQGVLLGDPTGTPPLFPYLVGGTTCLTTLVALVLRLWAICATYYVYATIEARQGRRDTQKEEATAA